MSDQTTAERVVDITISEPALTSAVLERLVSAAAARADLPIDHMINALTVVDALVHALDTVLGERERALSLVIGEQTLALRVNDLSKLQTDALREAAYVPELGDVIGHTAAKVAVENVAGQNNLVIVLD